MARGYRRLSPADEDEIWAWLRAGHAAKPTARALGWSTSGVRGYLVRCGGIRPSPRRRSLGRLSLTEREEISRGLAAGLSLRSIAAGLGRAPSTISREVTAHGGRGRYRAAPADQQAWARARRPQACKLATHPALRAIVGGQLKQRWSPQQIAGWLKTTYPDDPEMQVSHETIYRTLFIQSRGALRRELTAHLRTGRVIRRPQSTRLPDGRGGRPGILNISWNVATGELVDRINVGGEQVVGLTFSPDDRTLFTVAEPSHQVSAWDLAGRRTFLARIPVRHAVQIQGGNARISHDGTRILTESNAGTYPRFHLVAKIVDLEHHTTTKAQTLHRDSAGAASWAPDDSRVVLGVHGVVTLIDGQTGGELARRTVLPDEIIDELSYSADGRYVLATDMAGDVVRLDPKTLRPDQPPCASPRTPTRSRPRPMAGTASLSLAARAGSPTGTCRSTTTISSTSPPARS